jgi:hypothetical protein
MVLDVAQLGMTALVIPLIKVLLSIKMELAHFNATVESLIKRIERVENWQDRSFRDRT